jgi:transcription initiation factor TFIIB
VRSLAIALEASGTVIDRASYLFRRATDEGLLVGQSIEAVAAACIHAAARDAGTPFPLAQISARSPVEKSAITSAFYKIVRELELPIAPPEPAEFVPRIASEVGMSVSIRECALDILEQLVEDEEHVGQSPAGVAVAALYGASREEGRTVTQAELADAAYVSVVTLSRQWQTVEEYVT